jgi:nitroreductase
MEPDTTALDPNGLHAFDQVLATTRSVRRKLDFERPVPPEVIEACIDLAVQAPTGGNREGWRFLVVTSAEQKQRLAEIYRKSFELFARLREEAARAAPGTMRDSASPNPPPPPRPQYRELAENLHRVPVLIVCCIEGRADPTSTASQVALYGSILPAAWSLMLALRSRGLGATWTTLHLRHEAEAAAVLGIPDGVTQTVLLPVGYMKDAVLKPAARKPAREVTYWDRWGETRAE